MKKSDLVKDAQVVDMMLSMHSILENRYARLALGLDLFSMLVSTVLVATVFLDPIVLQRLGVDESTARLIIGFSSIFVFFLSLIGFKVDWSGMASSHREAFNTLVMLKAEWKKTIQTYDENDQVSVSEFSARSSLIIKALIPIEDKKFNALKARHYKKIVLSKLISSHKGCPLWILKMYLIIKSMQKLINEPKKSEHDNEHQRQLS